MRAGLFEVFSACLARDRVARSQTVVNVQIRSFPNVAEYVLTSVNLGIPIRVALAWSRRIRRLLPVLG
jgi:hypothetical protein